MAFKKCEGIKSWRACRKEEIQYQLQQNARKYVNFTRSGWALMDPSLMNCFGVKIRCRLLVVPRRSVPCSLHKNTNRGQIDSKTDFHTRPTPPPSC